jgi:hypothetical protein
MIWRQSVGDRQRGNATACAMDLTNLGAVLQCLGDHERALACLEEALQLWETTQDPYGLGTTLYNIGNVHSRLPWSRIVSWTAAPRRAWASGHGGCLWRSGRIRAGVALLWDLARPAAGDRRPPGREELHQACVQVQDQLSIGQYGCTVSL